MNGAGLPPTTLGGLNATPLIATGNTVTKAPIVIPSVAVMVTISWLLVKEVVIGKVAPLAPWEIATEPVEIEPGGGIWAKCGLLSVRLTVVLAGAGPLSIISPCVLIPPTTVDGIIEKLANTVVDCWVKLAVTASAAFIVTVHSGALDEQPLHPVKVDPDAGTAVKVTVVPGLKSTEQLTPQFTEPSLLVTVPRPVPWLATDNLKLVVKDDTADQKPGNKGSGARPWTCQKYVVSGSRL